MYHLTEAYLMATMISLLAALLGGLTVSALLTAKLIKQVGVDEHSAWQAFWQRYHAIAVIGGLAITLMSAAASPFSALPAVYSSLVIALAGLMTVCFITSLRLLTLRNRQTAERSLTELPQLSAGNKALMSAGLSAGVLLIASLIYVLPGQFTFWPSYSDNGHAPFSTHHQPLMR